MDQSPGDKLTRISMTLAVLAAFSTLSIPVVLPFILASVAIVLADLSRGSSQMLSKRGKRASGIAVAAIIVNLFLLVVSAIYFYRVLHEPQLQQQFAELLYNRYGITYEELMKQLGISGAAAP